MTQTKNNQSHIKAERGTPLSDQAHDAAFQGIRRTSLRRLNALWWPRLAAPTHSRSYQCLSNGQCIFIQCLDVVANEVNMRCILFMLLIWVLSHLYAGGYNYVRSVLSRASHRVRGCSGSNQALLLTMALQFSKPLPAAVRQAYNTRCDHEVQVELPEFVHL
jgi:hypothetical protein